jgi:CheY-like chemotaxis protein
MQRQALVVDDSRVARLTLSKLLAPYNLDIVQIASGEEAISYLNSDNVNPDVIFMDVTMQGLDGLETTKKIKENEALSAIPVVMCTGHDTQLDNNNAMAAGAIAALTKPPQRKMLDDIMMKIESREPTVEAVQVEHHDLEIEISSVMSAQQMDTTPSTKDDDILARLEQQWLPKIKTSLYERVGDMTRRISAETVSGIMANQLSHSTPGIQDTSQLEIDISAKVESELLPKIQQTIQAAVEDFSRQIMLDSLDESVASEMKRVLPALKEQLKDQTKLATIEVAQQTAQQMIDDSVESAVQFAIDDYDLPAKATATLEKQGQEWLTQQEQYISQLASQQVEQNLSPLVAQYLDMNLAEKINSHLAEVEAEKPKEEEDESKSLLAVQMEELTKKVSFLKETVMVLSIVVVGAVAIALLQNSGLL